jgi:3-hydroxyacyl-[acyl-carrier-protein] dehydratase
MPAMRWVFLRSITELEPGRIIRGTARFPSDLELFQDHFPGWPVVPGVLLLEAMAQLAGKGIGYSVRLQRGDWPFPILSMMQNVKFRKFVRPDEEIELEAEFEALRDESAALRVRTRLNGRTMAQADQVFVFNAVPLEDPTHRAKLEDTEKGELARLWPGFEAAAWDAASSGAVAGSAGSLI